MSTLLSQDIFTNRLSGQNWFTLEIADFVFPCSAQVREMLFTPRNCYDGRENVTASLKKFPKTHTGKALHVRIQ